MSVYELTSDNDTIFGMEVETVPWLPVKPRIRHGWLRFLVAAALRQYFRSSAGVVKTA